jgi:hypothetical protein
LIRILKTELISGGSSDVLVPGPSTPSKSKVTVKVKLEDDDVPLREMTAAEVAAFSAWKDSPGGE